jgi:hypothetical protein
LRSATRTLLLWLTLCVAVARPAHADRLLEGAVPPAEPPVGWAVAGGALTAMLPLAVGASLYGTHDDLGPKKAGSVVMVSGMALAPIVSHLAVKEWARAGIFGAIPVASAIGMIVLMEIQPSAALFGTRPGYLTYALTLSFGTLGAGIGLIDTFGATRRAAERRALGPPKRSNTLIVPAPLVVPGGGGLAIGGHF